MNTPDQEHHPKVPAKPHLKRRKMQPPQRHVCMFFMFTCYRPSHSPDPKDAWRILPWHLSCEEHSLSTAVHQIFWLFGTCIWFGKMRQHVWITINNWLMCARIVVGIDQFWWKTFTFIWNLFHWGQPGHTQHMFFAAQRNHEANGGFAVEKICTDTFGWHFRCLSQYRSVVLRRLWICRMFSNAQVDKQGNKSNCTSIELNSARHSIQVTRWMGSPQNPSVNKFCANGGQTVKYTVSCHSVRRSTLRDSRHSSRRNTLREGDKVSYFFSENVDKLCVWLCFCVQMFERIHFLKSAPIFFSAEHKHHVQNRHPSSQWLPVGWHNVRHFLIVCIFPCTDCHRQIPLF